MVQGLVLGVRGKYVVLYLRFTARFWAWALGFRLHASTDRGLGCLGFRRLRCQTAEQQARGNTAVWEPRVGSMGWRALQPDECMKSLAFTRNMALNILLFMWSPNLSKCVRHA